MDGSEVNDAIRNGLELLIQQDLEVMHKTITSGAEIDPEKRRLCKNAMEIYEQNVTGYSPTLLEKFVSNYNGLVGDKYAIEIPEIKKRFTDVWNKAK